MISAIFEQSGGGIIVMFDQLTDGAGMTGRGPCDPVLDPTSTIPLLGASPECFWFHPNELHIHLGNSFKIDRGKGKIKVKPQSLRSIAQNSEFAIGELSPDFPADPPVPAIQVRSCPGLQPWTASPHSASRMCRCP